MPDLVVTKSTIDFSAGLSSAQDELAGAPSQVVNVLKDATGWIRLVPGTSAWSWSIPSFGSAVLAMRSFSGGLIAVTQDRLIHWIPGPGVTVTLGTLDGTLTPVIAATRYYVFIAGGGAVSYWTPALGAAGSLSGIAPIASHVVGNSERLVALVADNSGRIRWTEADQTEAAFLKLDPEGWNTLNFAQAEARPDPGLALEENSDEVYVFGSQTVQIFTPDPNDGYSSAYTLNRGVGARYSVVNMLDQRLFAWLTDEREIVTSSIRDEPTVISYPDIAKTLKEMSTVDDCRGSYVKIGNFRLLVFMFPTAGETLAYDLDAKRWFRLRGYDSTIGDWATWPVTALYYWAEQNVYLAGLSSGAIHVLDMDALTVGGQPLVGEVVLGYDNGGSDGPKQTLTLRAPMARGASSNDTTRPPIVEVYYRDRPGAWSRPIPFSLGAPGDTQPVVVRRIVTRPYIRRQWRLRLGAGVRARIGPIEATNEILED